MHTSNIKGEDDGMLSAADGWIMAPVSPYFPSSLSGTMMVEECNLPLQLLHFSIIELNASITYTAETLGSAAGTVATAAILF